MGRPVTAIEAGTVVFAINDPVIPSNSRMAVRSADHGWNYLHMIPGINPATGVPWVAGNAVAAGVQLGTVSVGPGTHPSHLHLEYTAVTADPVQVGMLRPIDDPLYYLALKDTTRPTIDSDIHFRTAATDTVTAPAGGARTRQDETPRDDQQYFFELVANRLVVGAKATTLDSEANAGTGSADIDVIANAYDQFTAGGTRIGVKWISFEATGVKFLKTTGSVDVLVHGGEFTTSAIAPVGHNYGSLSDFYLVRSVYSNDVGSNSADRVDNWYTVTNYDGDLHVVEADRNSSWRTTVQAGQNWYDAAAPRGTSNTTSAFVDDHYDIKISAYDNTQNSRSVTKRVLLDNWVQTVETNKRYYTTQQNVTITGGEQYVANRLVTFYRVQDNLPAAGAALTGRLTSDLADANGKLPQVNLGTQPVGTYYIIADYDNDGVFTPRLDAYTIIGVIQAAPGKAAVGGRAWADFNGDGIRTTDETGVAGLLVSLFDAQGNLVATTVTTSDGAYLFQDIDLGTYRVQFDLPAPPTLQDQGSDDSKDSDIDSTGSVAFFSLLDGDLKGDLDAGFLLSGGPNPDPGPGGGA